MFTILTQSPNEKGLLDLDYPYLKDRFHVKIQESPAIAGILRSISYQLFHSSPSALAQKITQMAIDSLHLQMSLALFRQILVKIKQMQRLITLYHQHFLSLSRIMGSNFSFEPKQISFNFRQEISVIHRLQQLDSYPSLDILFTDLQEELQNISAIKKQEKTRKTLAQQHLRKHQDNFPNKEQLQLTNYNLFSLRQQQGAEWWKLKHRGQNNSKQISHFQMHHPKLMLNTISNLMQQEQIFDNERQEKQEIQEEQQKNLNFKKLMKQRILKAKLSKRRR